MSTFLYLLFFILSFLYCCPDPAWSMSITNTILGVPDVTCVRDGVLFKMETKEPFTGKLYVRNEYKQPECLADFEQSKRKLSAQGSFRVQFNQCGMRRQRIASPTQGMAYSVTMIVQFHETFVTASDKAFNIRCFYREQKIGITAEEIFVSPLTTSVLSVDHPIPRCSYSIRHTSVDGPLASYVRVGDPIVHVFRCENSADGVYNMLVKECYVDDGKTNKKAILDEKGCTLDPFIIQTPQYPVNAVEVFAEATVFKWPDEPAVYFSCQLTLCVKEDPDCSIVVPPACNPLKLLRVKRDTVPGLENSTTFLENSTSVSDKKSSRIEFDLRVKRLIVMDIDHEPQEVSNSPNPTVDRVDIPTVDDVSDSLDENPVALINSSLVVPDAIGDSLATVLNSIPYNTTATRKSPKVIQNSTVTHQLITNMLVTTTPKQTGENVSLYSTITVMPNTISTHLPAKEVQDSSPNEPEHGTKTALHIAQKPVVQKITTTSPYEPADDRFTMPYDSIVEAKVEDVTGAKVEIVPELASQLTYKNNDNLYANKNVCYGIEIVIAFSCVTTLLVGVLTALTFFIVLPIIKKKWMTNQSENDSSPKPQTFSTFDPNNMYQYLYPPSLGVSTINLNQP